MTNITSIFGVCWVIVRSGRYNGFNPKEVEVAELEHQSEDICSYIPFH